MNADRLLAFYERIADAPDAIVRFRRFILDLAVRGKLVGQDPNDEPASELLKRIAAEKARLVKAGEIRKPRDLDGGNDLPTPFEVPTCWRWVRLDGVGAIIGGGTPSASDSDNFADPGTGVPWLTPADLGGFSERFISRGARDLSEKGLQTSSATLMPAGTVLFTSRAPVGYIAIAANPISTNQGFKSIVPYVPECSRFIALAMKTFAPEIDAKAPGTTFKEVSGKIVAGVSFSLPPLAEQRRIVAKVDELMALCDQLDVARAKREATRDRLATASLARLNAPDPDPDTFRNHAAFAVENLAPLTTRLDQIKALRQTILSLAVCGKLVEQDPNDEPASELLKRIAAEKARLVKAELIKRPKQLRAVESDDTEFCIPSSWCWTRLGEVTSYIQRGKSPKYASKSGALVVSQKCVQWSGLNLNKARKITYQSLAAYEDIRFLREGDLLWNSTGTGTIGRVIRLIDPPERLVCDSHVTVVRCLLVSPEYIRTWLRTGNVYGLIEERAAGSTNQVELTAQMALNQVVPLPPLAEQHRIVAKVDELMALCDRLEINLGIADTGRQHLLESLLRDVLVPSNEPRPAPKLGPFEIGHKSAT